MILGAPARRKKCRNGVHLRVNKKSPAVADAWAPTDDECQRGVCTTWNAQRGYGFLTVVQPSDSESAHSMDDFQLTAHRRVFVHNSDIIMDGFRRLNVGQEVEFKLTHDPASGRTKATEVVLANDVSGELDDLLAIVTSPPGIVDLWLRHCRKSA